MKISLLIIFCLFTISSFAQTIDFNQSSEVNWQKFAGNNGSRITSYKNILPLKNQFKFHLAKMNKEIEQIENDIRNYGDKFYGIEDESFESSALLLLVIIPKLILKVQALWID